MATQNVCSWFKFGYCRHREYCRRQHVKDICEKIECEVSNCISRHPKICKFYRDYGKCKFNPCMFRHVKDENSDQVEALKKENESILKKLENIEKSMNDLDVQMEQSEDIIEKLKEVDRKFEKVIEIEKEIYNRDSEILNLLERVDAIEKKLQEKDKFIDEVDRKFEKVIEIEKEICIETLKFRIF